MKKKFRLGFLCLLIVVLFLGCSLFGHQVRFEVTGSPPSAWVVYSTLESGVVTLNSVSLPWSYTFTGHTGEWVEINAAGTNGNADVTVTIYEDGSVLMTGIDGAYGAL